MADVLNYLLTAGFSLLSGIVSGLLSARTVIAKHQVHIDYLREHVKNAHARIDRVEDRERDH